MDAAPVAEALNPMLASAMTDTVFADYENDNWVLEPKLDGHSLRGPEDQHGRLGTLEGMKLIGFAIWERRGGSGRNVTFPARQYAVNGERRSFALLRPIVDTTAQERIRALVLAAEYEEQREAGGVA